MSIGGMVFTEPLEKYNRITSGYMMLNWLAWFELKLTEYTVPKFIYRQGFLRHNLGVFKMKHDTLCVAADRLEVFNYYDYLLYAHLGTRSLEASRIHGLFDLGELQHCSAEFLSFARTDEQWIKVVMGRISQLEEQCRVSS